MSAGSTPGWVFRPADDRFADAFVTDEPSGDLVAICHPPHQNERGRLIAAAPDMLGVCKALLDIIYNSQGVAGWHRNGDVAAWDEFESVAELEAAVAKAEAAQ